MALWRSWLARLPVTEKVAGSSPVGVAREMSVIGLRARDDIIIEAPHGPSR